MNQNGGIITTGPGGTGTSLTSDQILKSGGYSNNVINVSQGGANFQITADWRVAGYQEMLDTIRATGAQNVCMVAGNYWAQDLSGYQTFMPTDSANQLAFSWHAYPQGGYPYANGNNYPSCGQYSAGSHNAAAFDPANNIIAAGYPVIIGEDGGYGGTNNTANDEPHFTTMTNWVDQQPGVSYVVWQWNFTQAYGTTDGYNYLTAFASDGKTVLPLQGCGNVLYNWMANHA